jgi:hypothetical protein
MECTCAGRGGRLDAGAWHGLRVGLPSLVPRHDID